MTRTMLEVLRSELTDQKDEHNIILAREYFREIITAIEQLTSQRNTAERERDEARKELAELKGEKQRQSKRAEADWKLAQIDETIAGLWRLSPDNPANQRP